MYRYAPPFLLRSFYHLIYMNRRQNKMIIGGKKKEVKPGIETAKA